MPGNTGNDFIDTIEKSQQVPESMGSSQDVDPAGFSAFMPEGVQHINEVSHPKEPVRLNYKADRAVILIYDPNIGEIDDGLTRYRELMDRILGGEFLLRSEKEIEQKDGSILISLSWMVPVDLPKKIYGNGEGPDFP